MQNHTQTRNIFPSAPELKPEQRQESLRLQRVDVLDLQKAIIAKQTVPITYRSGVPFSALNDRA